MMLQGAELLLILMVIFVIFGLTRLGPISRGLARLRLNYEKGVAEDSIELGQEGETKDEGSGESGG